MGAIKYIVLHCSDSPFGSASMIRLWHTAKKPQGRGWPDIGYQFVIMNGHPTDTGFYLEPLDGAIECGRRLDGDGIIEADEIGFHTIGMNQVSIAVCLVGWKKGGNPTFTIRQFDALKELLVALCKHFGVAPENVVGHCETESGKAEGKTCPDFDVAPFRTWLKGRV